MDSTIFLLNAYSNDLFIFLFAQISEPTGRICTTVPLSLNFCPHLLFSWFRMKVTCSQKYFAGYRAYFKKSLNPCQGREKVMAKRRIVTKKRKKKESHLRIVFLTPNYIISMTASQLSLIIQLYLSITPYFQCKCPNSISGLVLNCTAKYPIEKINTVRSFQSWIVKGSSNKNNIN